MRVFFYKDVKLADTIEKELTYIDTDCTPIFISCLPSEREFFTDAAKETDSYCIYDYDMDEESLTQFVKGVYIMSEKLNAGVENEITVPED